MFFWSSLGRLSQDTGYNVKLALWMVSCRWTSAHFVYGVSPQNTANSALLQYAQLAEEQWRWLRACLFMVGSVGKMNSFLSKSCRDGAVFCG